MPWYYQYLLSFFILICYYRFDSFNEISWWLIVPTNELLVHLWVFFIKYGIIVVVNSGFEGFLIIFPVKLLIWFLFFPFNELPTNELVVVGSFVGFFCSIVPIQLQVLFFVHRLLLTILQKNIPNPYLISIIFNLFLGKKNPSDQ